MARPRKQISERQVKELAQIGCSYEEMESVLGVSHQTIIRRFGQAIKEGRNDMQMSLRRWQYKAAQKGSTGMLIWLGKQHLGQSDKAEFSGTMTHEHIDLSRISDTDLGTIASLVESAATSPSGPQK